MLHLRLISPEDRTDKVLAQLDGTTGVTNVVLLRAAARTPPGDVIMCDVAREAANEVLDELRRFGLSTEGSIAGEQVDLVLSDAAERAKEEAPGEGDDAVVWEDLARKVDNDCKLTWAFMVFLAIATQIAGIGVLVDSPILIVGAMVLGPEFGAVAAICFGMLFGRGLLIARAAMTLVTGFAIAIAITFACALVSGVLGWIDPDMLVGNAEVEFIVKPDRWSFIVALLAGVAGVLSITAGKSSALVGVFISVTTVPAAGYAAVALALGQWGEVAGSAAQLAVNITGMIIAGVATLFVQRLFWTRYHLPLPAQRPPGE
ncbi:uncharacterized hydrophobic domain-containing protein [Sinosporangium album]|uniref:Uncharacterized hydrophobic domain-containing protein n=1 Tax=Sinosporangium album TaxID=504805 RepID=A0A1G8D205_9ACTN|nr:DUF389 domain-containing protein [Sinosporangium album]SDH51808.1 uncharacterized hydrophobic domain-containing protein [Sinosporangium album]